MRVRSYGDGGDPIASNSLPSKVTEDYWIRSRPPVSEFTEHIKFGVEWFEENAVEYAKSAKMFPRDIFADDLIEPQSEPEITLHAIDLETIKTVNQMGSNGYPLLSGKWLIYVSRSNVDEVWKSLSSNIETGKLPCNAKVSTTKSNPLADQKEKHVICVYTPDYLFRDDVRQCRLLLKQLGFEARLYYKPDVFTYKRMYRITGSPINHRYFG
jgi:hypothetical protein